MEQINNQKSLRLSVFYFFSGLVIDGVPFFLKNLFKTYCPDFYYPLLTVPICMVFVIVGFQKLQAFTNTSIRQTFLLMYEANTFFFLKFREAILFRCKFWREFLLGLFKSSQSYEKSTEPMAEVHRRSSRKYSCLVDIFLGLLIFYIPFLFWHNVPRWGWFETSITVISNYAFFIYLSICLYYLMAVDATKQQKNAHRSDKDLQDLLKMLKNQLKDWRFEYRVVLPSSDLKAKKGDIDVVAVSQDSKYFVIELKSHVGDVFWNSKSKELRRQYGKNLESKPFEKDIFDQINGQARRLKTFNKLSRKPERILLFWRATVKINKNDRVKRGVLISNKESLIDDLRERNNDLSK